ncbi:hypothetical protein GCM10010168_79040 [Actinoplanes ianthinogenes]|uniref:Transposase n=1 Tax=Actinoplanes ianthinogenes TaxID=122358 RepID=A0ABM7LK45_9ACTN|nr:MarR family transcriptional regulator [Actinoplanes ianthinogenes]BCJ39641.1 hypothetical protein Aiant_02980 [Actinoplanes ianthinogenes]GGR48389.1 hypothetical protein GCM10010168_79040 [Actinoplanes ianthinogenes]
MTLSDADLAAQPAAYWTGVAYESLIAFTRARQAEFGFSQPQFWLLRHLSVNDLSPDGQGRSIPALREAMAEYLRAEDDLAAEAETLLGRGWLRLDEDGLWWLTEEGEAARVRFQGHAPEIRARIHDGVDDADYLVALKVLRRMIENTGGAG